MLCFSLVIIPNHEILLFVILQVERTVREVLPTVKEHRGNVSDIHSALLYALSIVKLLMKSHNNTSPGIKIGQLDIFVVNLKEKLDAKQKEAAAWKAKYNIKTQEEAEAAAAKIGVVEVG